MVARRSWSSGREFRRIIAVSEVSVHTLHTKSNNNKTAQFFLVPPLIITPPGETITISQDIITIHQMAATTNGKSNTADKPRKQPKIDTKVNKPDHTKRTTARKRHIFTMDQEIQQERQRYSSPAEEGPIVVKARKPVTANHEDSNEGSEAKNSDNTSSIDRPNHGSELMQRSLVNVDKATVEGTSNIGETLTSNDDNTPGAITAAPKPTAAINPIQQAALDQQTSPFESARAIETPLRRSQRVRKAQQAPSPEVTTNGPTDAPEAPETENSEEHNEESAAAASMPPTINSMVMNPHHQMQHRNWIVLSDRHTEFLRRRGKLQWMEKR